MRVALVSDVADGDVRGFSGIPFHMAQAMRANTAEFQYIRVPSVAAESLLDGGDQAIEKLRAAAAMVSRQLEEARVDVAVCSGAGIIPWLQTRAVVVLWHDSTWLSCFRLGVDEFRSRFPSLYEMDRLTLQRCDIVAFAAEWLRPHTVAAYGVASEKIHMVPFGANLPLLPESQVQTAVDARRFDQCRLVFLGIDWMRKGLPMAYEVLKQLRARGLSACLTAIGCDVTRPSYKHQLKSFLSLRKPTELEAFRFRFTRDAHAQALGLLNKDVPQELHEWQTALSAAHFLLHPAEFEPFGIALAEANAFGVPVLATSGFGPSTIVQDGVNGFLFERQKYVTAAATLIQICMNEPDFYRGLAKGAYAEYKTRLNWTKSWSQLSELLATSLITRNARAIYV